MRGLSLQLQPALEMGALSAFAEVQDPYVQVEQAADRAALRILEGAVDVTLVFPDLDALRRFCARVRHLSV